MENVTITTSTNDQTQDFMNVDSFSKLPFLRSSPTTTKDNKSVTTTSSSASAIRLFGIDFSSSTTTEISNSGDDDNTTNKDDDDKNNNNNNNVSSNNSENGDSSRKFECHYCCRNFPTSQALGGHQNAHKRERQHAKRAHLQSAMMASDHHHPHHHHNHLYNHLMNYRSSPTSNTYSSPNYHSTLPNNTSRFTTTNPTTPSHFINHNRHQHTPPTINGNPLVWRVPTIPHSDHSRAIYRDRSVPTLAYYGGVHNSSNNSSNNNINNNNNNNNKNTSKLLNINPSSSSKNSMSSSQTQIGRRGGSDHHVSLDLRL